MRGNLMPLRTVCRSSQGGSQVASKSCCEIEAARAEHSKQGSCRCLTSIRNACAAHIQLCFLLARLCCMQKLLKADSLINASYASNKFYSRLAVVNMAPPAHWDSLDNTITIYSRSRSGASNLPGWAGLLVRGACIALSFTSRSRKFHCLADGGFSLPMPSQIDQEAVYDIQRHGYSG